MSVAWVRSRCDRPAVQNRPICSLGSRGAYFVSVLGIAADPPAAARPGTSRGMTQRLEEAIADEAPHRPCISRTRTASPRAARPPGRPRKGSEL